MASCIIQQLVQLLYENGGSLKNVCSQENYPSKVTITRNLKIY